MTLISFNIERIALVCVFQQGDCVISNVLTLDLTQYEDSHQFEEDERLALLSVR